ncbi:hypothetical protein AURDEDRAFT_168340 [Auricularia subglabra TFB-10046 SS5]|nr:hypothetical protein AURDEDRAFT_168340 [Auricularia subglabra TFB-10046 SS5]
MDSHFFGESIVQSFTTTSWASVASITWAVYDYVLTLDDEIVYIWVAPSALSLISSFSISGAETSLYNMPPNRSNYWRAFILMYAKERLISRDLSSGPINWVLLIQFFLFYTVEVALQMRVYAIYRRSRALLILNTTLFLLEITAMLAVWWTSGCRIMTRTRSWGGASGVVTSACAQENGFPWYWIPGFAFELWLATLALYKALQRAPQQKLKKDILSTIINDSGIYFGLYVVSLTCG